MICIMPGDVRDGTWYKTKKCLSKLKELRLSIEWKYGTSYWWRKLWFINSFLLKFFNFIWRLQYFGMVWRLVNKETCLWDTDPSFLGCSSGHQYHSWSYYRDNFGIYDDDPEIITLNKADFGEKTLSLN